MPENARDIIGHDTQNLRNHTQLTMSPLSSEES